MKHGFKTAPRKTVTPHGATGFVVVRPFTDVDGRAYAAGDSYAADGPSLAYLLERGCLDAPVEAGAGGGLQPPVTLPLEPEEVNDDATDE